MTRTLAAVFVILLLALSCAFCATQPEPNVESVIPVPDPIRVPHLGGPLYRVFDVDEIDSIDALSSIESIYRSAEECTGIQRDFTVVRVFFVSKIMVRTKDGWSDAFVGMRTWNKPWIYILRGRNLDQIVWTLKHEFVHYLTDLGHPESDVMLEACGVLKKARTP